MIETGRILAARVERITRQIDSLHGSGDLFFVSVVCNGCGRMIEARSVLAMLPLLDGWKLGEAGQEADFCPDCLT